MAPLSKRSEQRKMAAWIRKFRYHPAVVRWLEDNPPPAEWQGTPIEWAYTEMWGAPT